MPTYKILVIETRQKEVEIEAETIQKAFQEVQRLYGISLPPMGKISSVEYRVQK